MPYGRYDPRDSRQARPIFGPGLAHLNFQPLPSDPYRNIPRGPGLDMRDSRQRRPIFGPDLAHLNFPPDPPDQYRYTPRRPVPLRYPPPIEQYYSPNVRRRRPTAEYVLPKDYLQDHTSGQQPAASPPPAQSDLVQNFLHNHTFVIKPAVPPPNIRAPPAQNAPQGQRSQGPYDVIKKLGEGGEGVAHLVRRNRDNSLIVRKTIRHNLLAADNLTNEVTMLRDHVGKNKRIVNFHNHEWDPRSNQLMMYFDYYEGGDLRHAIPKGVHVAENIVWHVFSQVAQALEYIHSRSIVHCDVKVRAVH